MSESTFMGVERSLIEWKPTIDYEKCNYCLECVSFCPHNVFEVREDEAIRLLVKNPHNCVVFCIVCSKTCGLDAILFPDKNFTIQRITEIRNATEAKQVQPDLHLDEQNKMEYKDRPSSVEPGSAFAFKYETFQKGKFIFRIPKNPETWFNENDCWALIRGNIARIGVTDWVQQNLSDILYFYPPEIGAEINQFGDAGSIESSKAVFDLVSPVSGRVISVNSKLGQHPELINENPYESGWIAEIELQDPDSDKKLLIGFEKYFEIIRKKAEETNV